MKNHMTYHYQQVILYDLLTKIPFQNLFELPKTHKICLNIGFKELNTEKKKLISIYLLLKLISNQRPQITTSNKNNIFLKIKKGSIIGCKMTLRKKNIPLFLEKLFLFVRPSFHSIEFQQQTFLNFQIPDVLSFFELKTEFLKFQNINQPLDISIHLHTQNEHQSFLLLNSFSIL